VLGELEEQLSFLRKLVEEEGKPTENLLEDLLANAERRAETGRYDDALARLYRALELAAEADLYHRTGIVLGAPDTWPESLPERFLDQAYKNATPAFWLTEPGRSAERTTRRSARYLTTWACLWQRPGRGGDTR